MSEPGTQLVRVFEIAERGLEGQTKEVTVDLPTAWARDHDEVRVLLRDTEVFGMHATVVGSEGEQILSLGWHDHAEEKLLGRRPCELPVTLCPGGSWEHMEQGWWARIIDLDGLVYVAETDADALIDAPMPPTELTCRAPGEILVSGVAVTWSRMPRSAYDAAWRGAIATLLEGGRGRAS